MRVDDILYLFRRHLVANTGTGSVATLLISIGNKCASDGLHMNYFAGGLPYEGKPGKQACCTDA